MTVLDTTTIDIIGVSKENGDLTLCISDHLEWGDETDQHLEAIQTKVNTYLQFVGGSQIHQSARTQKGQRVVIECLMQNIPPAEALGFLRMMISAVAVAPAHPFFGKISLTFALLKDGVRTPLT